AACAARAWCCSANMRSFGYSQDTEAIHAFLVEVSSSRYVRRLVVMTRLVLRPDRMGLTSTSTCRSLPVPLEVSPTIQRTVSPAATVTRSSPDCREITVTRPTAVQTWYNAPSLYGQT